MICYALLCSAYEDILVFKSKILCYIMMVTYHIPFLKWPKNIKAKI